MRVYYFHDWKSPIKLFRETTGSCISDSFLYINIVAFLPKKDMVLPAFLDRFPQACQGDQPWPRALRVTWRTPSQRHCGSMNSWEYILNILKVHSKILGGNQSLPMSCFILTFLSSSQLSASKVSLEAGCSLKIFPYHLPLIFYQKKRFWNFWVSVKICSVSNFFHVIKSKRDKICIFWTFFSF